MKQFQLVIVVVLLGGLLCLPTSRAVVHAQLVLPVVHAVLFYSPACPHCHYVITETLPPLFEKYGEQFQIIGIDVTSTDGQILFLAALQKSNLEEGGVPLLVIGNTFLVGSVDIPEQLPDLIDLHLAQGGVGWPDIPGLKDALAQTSEVEAASTSAPPDSVSPTKISPLDESRLAEAQHEYPTWQENFARDLRGNVLSVLILAGMLGSLAWLIIFLRRAESVPLQNAWQWATPVLCILGLGVATYLTYVESAQVAAVCGPVGDCNTVQQSEYALLFGILPIGVLGMTGYLGIAASWLVSRLTKGHPAKLAALTLLIMTITGTLFSVYLTFLEPFVIGATCAWCLSSAIAMTCLMILSARPGKLAAIHLLNRQLTRPRR